MNTTIYENALALVRELAGSDPVEGSTGINVCRYCDHSWPEHNGHHANCLWVRARQVIDELGQDA